jgi:hypothetical protein
VTRSLLVLTLVAGVAGACYVAAPVFRKTWPVALVAVAAAVAFAGVRIALYAKAEIPVERRKRGLCVGCGYDLTGNVSGVCPGCGGAR